MLAKRNRIVGGPRSTSWDQHIVTRPTLAYRVGANVNYKDLEQAWGTGDDIGTIIVTNVSGEWPSSLTAGAGTYRPTILVNGKYELEIMSTGITGLNYEYVLGTSNTNSVTTTTTMATAFGNAWAQSFNARPTGYEDFAATSLLENHAFWNNRSSLSGLKAVGYGKGHVGLGKAKKLTFKFKTRRFSFPEYSFSSFLTDGMIPGKSYRIMLRFWGDTVQVCGVKSAVNQPMIAESGTPFILRQRAHYRYKWIPGNTSPTIYGSQLATNETIASDALGWDSIPALHATRDAAYSAEAEVGAAFPAFGRMDINRRHVSVINPVLDCTGDPSIPTVNTEP